MKTVIDLGSELLIDQSKCQTPELRLLLAAIGKPMAAGSAWVAVEKRVAALYAISLDPFTTTAKTAMAA